MRKQITLLFYLLVGFSPLFFTISSCSNEPNSMERGSERNAMDAEAERLLKQDYWQYLFNDEQRSVFSVDDIRIDYYLGTYGRYVVFVNLSDSGIYGYGGVSRDGYESVSIHGYKFVFPTRFDMIVWEKGDDAKKSGFNSLLGYYDKVSLRYISFAKNNVIDMYKRYLAYNVINYENFYPGAFKGLDKETKRQIKHDWWHDIYDDRWRDYITEHSAFKDVWIDYYLGTYNDYVIIAVLRNSSWTSRIVINGYEFIFPSDFIMYAWKRDEDSKKGTFYRILNENDFINLSLTNEDADRMYDRYLTLNILNDKRLSPNAFDGLDAEKAWQLRYDYWCNAGSFFQSVYRTVDNVSIHNYLGTYNSNVVYVNVGTLTALDYIYIGGFTFIYPNLSNMYVWKHDENPGGGRFHIIREGRSESADWRDFITPEDVKNMYKLHSRKQIMYLM